MLKVLLKPFAPLVTGLISILVFLIPTLGLHNYHQVKLNSEKLKEWRTVGATVKAVNSNEDLISLMRIDCLNYLTVPENCLNISFEVLPDAEIQGFWGRTTILQDTFSIRISKVALNEALVYGPISARDFTIYHELSHVEAAYTAGSRQGFTDMARRGQKVWGTSTELLGQETLADCMTISKAQKPLPLGVLTPYLQADNMQLEDLGPQCDKWPEVLYGHR